MALSAVLEPKLPDHPHNGHRSAPRVQNHKHQEPSLIRVPKSQPKLDAPVHHVGDKEAEVGDVALRHTPQVGGLEHRGG